MQVIARLMDGCVDKAPVPEFGRTFISLAQHPLFKGLESELVWMNHNDAVAEPPKGFYGIAHTEHCPYAAFANDTLGLYGFQFHPEVRHTPNGAL